MIDEELFVVQQVELVTVERSFYSIDDHVHLVVGKLFGYLVAFADGSTVALLEIGWAIG